MNCADVEILISDYIDGTLGEGERQGVESHLAGCPLCRELAKDAAAAMTFLRSVAAVEPPPELVTRILYQAPSGATPAVAAERAQAGRLGRWWRGLLDPVLQPRFVMGMAMTILSFSMVGRIAGISQRQLTMADLDPVKVWQAIDDKLHRSWDRAVKYYENLRLVYEIQSRLQEWSAQEEELRRSQSGGSMLPPTAPARNRGTDESGGEERRDQQ